jgi:hypothetical protein
MASAEPRPRPQCLAHALDLLALAFCALAIFTAMTGPWRVALAGINVSAAHSSRLLTEALAILLVRLCVRPPKSIGLLFPAVLAALLFCAAAESRPRRIGDGHEYAAVALNLARLRPPALTDVEAAGWESRLYDWGPGFTLRTAGFANDGRWDQPHFWLYSLLAAPLVAAVEALGLSWTLGFLVLNVALLVLAARAFASAGASPACVLLLVGSPIVWWVDKVHVEPLAFSLLAVAIAAWPVAPGTALLALGALAGQNTAALPALVGASLLAAPRLARSAAPERSRALCAVVLALLPLAYSSVRLGRPLPLASAAFVHVPALTEVTALLFDPNLGLLPAFPALLVVAVLAARVPRSARRPLLAGRGAFAAIVTVLLIVSFTQTTNANHGGTPGPSRYGLWLVPLALPLALTAERRFDQGFGRSVWIAFCCVSFALCGGILHPRRAEQHLAPTPFAAWLWTHTPALDNPLPEVFAERVSGHESERGPRLPVATPACSKVLAQRSETGVWWPLRCPPPLDGPTSEATFVYANRAGSGWRWSAAPSQPAFTPSRAGEAAWIPPRDERARALFKSLDWERLRPVTLGTGVSLLSATRRTRRVVAFQSPRALLVWARNPKVHAEVVTALPCDATATVFDAENGTTEARVSGARPLHVPLPGERTSVVVVVCEVR